MVRRHMYLSIGEGEGLFRWSGVPASFYSFFGPGSQ